MYTEGESRIEIEQLNLHKLEDADRFKCRDLMLPEPILDSRAVCLCLVFTLVVCCLFGDSSQIFCSFDENTFPAKEVAIVQLSFDGINTFHCGVGTVVLQTQTVLKEFNQLLEEKDIRFKLYLVSGDYSQQLPEYSATMFERNKRDCNESGGEVFLVPISKNNQMFGDPEQWQELCEGGAKLCAQIINSNAYTIIIAHDTAYAHLPLQLKELACRGEIENDYQILWVPHATSWNYNGHTSNGTPQWPERHHWELEAFQQAAHYDYQIGCISQTIKQTITSFPFFVPESCLMPYQTGILLDSYLESISEDVIAEELTKRSIPLDKRLIFTIGRANPLKGLDITLEMYRHLKARFQDIHLVMVAPESDYMPSYLQLLKNRIEKECLDVTLIDSFDTDIARFIYQWPKTLITSLLSRADTRPLTIMEARTNPKNSLVLSSDPERMGKQVTSEINGFTCSLAGLDTCIEAPLPLEGAMKEIVDTAQQILELSDLERQKILKAGKELVLKEYDLRQNMTRNLNFLFQERSSLSHCLMSDYCSELSDHVVEISELYELPSDLTFKTLEGGVTNPPVAVFAKDKTDPLGIFKVEKDISIAAIRMKILSEIKSKSFQSLPLIFKDQRERYVTKIGDHFYSFMEFLSPDFRSITFKEMLELTGHFHHAVYSIVCPSILQRSKLDEFLTRYDIFFDPWFKQYNADIFQSSFWVEIIQLSHYFASDQFHCIYTNLPSQMIHGDNNQTNIVVSRNMPYLIDFESLRRDVRILDLASYFRYGGFNTYIDLIEQGNLVTMINDFYGTVAGKLTPQEEQSLHLVVAFSHIEFMSWALQVLKQAVIEKNQHKENEFVGYIIQYINQLRQLKNIDYFWKF